MGDPILRDFSGNKFEFFGEPDSVYNIYSDKAHQVRFISDCKHNVLAMKQHLMNLTDQCLCLSLLKCELHFQPCGLCR